MSGRNRQRSSQVGSRPLAAALGVSVAAYALGTAALLWRAAR
jgi:hypothetical protein